jgi:multidrug resistance efflux pump
MKKPLLTLGRVVLTLLVVILAAIVVWRMVMYYMYAPWTRDGHIRADVIQIAPDVSGLIEKVSVTDNQAISKGQVLFTIDQDRFRLALRQAQATLAERKETWEQAQRENKRNRGLGNLVAREQLEEKPVQGSPSPGGGERIAGRGGRRAVEPGPLGDPQPGRRLPQRPCTARP